MAEHIEWCRQWAKQGIEHTRSSTSFKKGVNDPKIVMYGAACLVVLAWLLIRATNFLKKPQASRPATPDLEKPSARSFKAPSRKPGSRDYATRNRKFADHSTVWHPMPFKRPTAAPAPNWDVHTTRPNPYRPFRHGPYHITMGLRNMNWDEWIGMLSTFPLAAFVLSKLAQSSTTIT